MPWHVQDPDGAGAVRLTIVGQIEPSGLAEAFGATLRTCLAHECFRVVCDLSELAAGHTVIDLYGLVTDLSEAVAGKDFREALVVGSDPRAHELGRFFETACLNRGIRARVFVDTDDALAWATA